MLASVLHELWSIVNLWAIFLIPFFALVYLSGQMCRVLGYKTVITLGFIGVPLHELSHAIMCVLTGKKITRIAFYQPCVDGTLGFVEYRYRPTMIGKLTNFLVGIAPLFGGIGGFAALTYWL